MGGEPGPKSTAPSLISHNEIHCHSDVEHMVQVNRYAPYD